MDNLQKIEKIFKMLGSSSDGEVLNAVYAIRNILLAQNKNFSDLANELFKPNPYGFEDLKNAYRQREYSPPPPPRSRHENIRTKEHKRMAQYLIDMPALMSTWESTFIKDIMEKNLSYMHGLSDKQAACLEKIYKNYHKETA